MEHLGKFEPSDQIKARVMGEFKADLVSECRKILTDYGMGTYVVDAVTSELEKELLKPVPEGRDENPRVMRAKAIDVVNESLVGESNREEIMGILVGKLKEKLDL